MFAERTPDITERLAISCIHTSRFGARFSFIAPFGVPVEPDV